MENYELFIGKEYIFVDDQLLIVMYLFLDFEISLGKESRFLLMTNCCYKWLNSDVFFSGFLPKVIEIGLGKERLLDRKEQKYSLG